MHRRLLVGAVAALALVALAWSVPERFPAVDGTLSLRTTDETVVAVASWATAAVPAPRRDCEMVVLVLPPGGREPTRVTGGRDPVRTGWSAAAQRVYEQYRDVLPPPLVRQLERHPLAVLLPATERGSVRLSWAHADAATAVERVRVLVAPVCADAVHGLVELRRLPR